MNRVVSIVSLVLLVAVAAATALAYFALPDPMPVHFDLHGRADGFGARAWGAWLVPAVAAAVWAGGRLARNATMALALSTTSIFLLVLHVLVLRAVLDGSMELGGGLALLLGAFAVAMGLVFPRLRRNRWVGIRLPWTLSSDENWSRAHRFGGAVYFFGGIATLAVAPLGTSATPIAIGILLAMTAIVTVGSWRMTRAS